MDPRQWRPEDREYGRIVSRSRTIRIMVALVGMFFISAVFYLRSRGSIDDVAAMTLTFSFMGLFVLYLVVDVLFLIRKSRDYYEISDDERKRSIHRLIPFFAGMGLVILTGRYVLEWGWPGYLILALAGGLMMGGIIRSRRSGS